MKRLAIIFMLIDCVSINSNAQSWSKVGTGVNALNANGGIGTIKFDAVGNMYVEGDFNDTSISYIGRYYVAKWNGNNWSKLGIGANALNANSTIGRSTIDNLNNIYVAGDFTDSLTSNKGSKYVAKWDGTFWSKLGGVNYLHANSFIRCLISDNAGNIYAAGTFTDGANSYLGKCYVAKWDGTNWSKLGTGSNALNAPAPNEIYGLINDNLGNIYAAGTFANASGKYYVAKWNGSNWTELGAGTNALNANNRIFGLTIDNAGNIYAAGDFTDLSGKNYIAKWNGTIWAELGTGSNALNANSRIMYLSTDIIGNVYAAGWFTNVLGKYYVAKWDGIKWVELGLGSNSLKANGSIAILATDTLNNVYAAGEFTDSIVWNVYGKRYVAKWTACWKHDTITQTVCANTGYYFHGALRTQAGFYNDTTGAYNGCDSVTTLHLTILPNLTKTATVVVCSHQGYTLHNGTIIYAAGNYTDTLPSATNGCDTIVSLTATTAFNTKTITAAICSNGVYTLPNGTLTHQAGTYTDTISSANNGCDTIITTHLSLLPNSSGAILYDTACASSYYDFYGTHLSTTGVYSHIIPNHFGCDSLITLHLTMSNFVLSVIQQGNILQASSAQWYQWLSCPTMQPIAGATHDTFQVRTSGSYAVEADVNGCVATTSCTTVNLITGIESLSTTHSALTVYPNPANTNLIIRQLGNEAIKYIEIENVVGQVVFHSLITSSSNLLIDVHDYPSGVYIIKATATNGNVSNAKFVKE